MKRLAKPLVVALLGLGLLVIPGASFAAQTTAGVHISKTVTRTNLINGHVDTVESRKVSLSVSQTTNLRGRQDIQVTWSGAHPTGGIYPDVNSDAASLEEYPFVLLQCRGVDSTRVSVAKQLRPETCWTQASDERYVSQWNRSQLAPWQLDQYATAAQRASVVGAPAPLPKNCRVLAPIQRWLPFVAVNGVSYPGGDNACGGMAPEASNVGGLSMPSNETYGVTSANGTGIAKFNVWTAEDNASLGCSSTVPCALVAVPIMGLSCDPSGSGLAASNPAVAACEANGFYSAGQNADSAQDQNLAVTGALWWAPSNWRNRITVPLSFAPSSNVCDLIGAKKPKQIYGSELLSEATDQWAPAFCLDPKRFNFKHVQVAEPEARGLLSSGGVEAVFDSNPAGTEYTKPVVHAPVAFSGFAIGYSIDDKSGNAYNDLRLTPRLLAKLLTESYAAEPYIQQEDPALAHNPLNLTQDPEFQALNPTVPKDIGNSEAAAELLNLSTQSDLVHALTAYINADPGARAWLNGTPDAWGMVVNPAYKGITLPVDSWPLLDTFQPSTYYKSGLNDCLQNQPVPYLPLVAAPVANLATISLNLQFALGNSTTTCQLGATGTSAGERLIAAGRQSIGHRFLIGLTTTADAQRYAINTAALQTRPGSFVAPTDGSLRSAALLLNYDSTTRTWPIPYGSILKSATAYPGSILVYADVPTTGLPRTDAADYAQLLRYLAGPGQARGESVGQLPAGYLPLTAANGLAPQARYTLEAASDVAGQAGLLPGQHAAPAPPQSGGSGPSSTAGTGAPITKAPTATALKPAAQNVSTGSSGTTAGVVSTLAGVVLPIFLGIGLCSLLLPGGYGVAQLLRRRP